MVGLDLIVSMALLDPHCYHMWLRGHERSTSRVRRFCAVALVVAQVAEPVHKQLMRDDRLLKFGNMYRCVVPHQLQVIASWPNFVWQRLSAATLEPDDWQSLKSECMSCCLTCASFLEREVFRDLEIWPWSLTQGNIMANLHDLRGRDPESVEDETAQKIALLLKMNYDENALARGLGLLREAACSVIVSEQAHGSGAVLVKQHSYCAGTLAARAGLHKLRVCFMPSPYDQSRSRMATKIAKLESKYCRCGGLHMFRRDQAEIANAVLAVPDRYDAMKQVFKEAPANYFDLTAAEQLDYDDIARSCFIIFCL